MSARDEARDTVLTRVRAALGVSGDETARRAEIAGRLARHPRGTIPSRVPKNTDDCVALLKEMLTSQGADVSQVPTQLAAVGAIASYLGSHSLSPVLHMGDDPVLAALPWKDAWDLERTFGPAEDSDRASLSRAVVAAAETGTLFLASGRDNPTTLNFLPEIHMVLVKSADVVGSYEEAWDRLRKVYGTGTLPRTVNLISGPSRTADIEQTIVRGAHGPRRLHVLILG
jgi:L-lactate dehydrogenase complex protein LldG